jgi:hypothetical protein
MQLSKNKVYICDLNVKGHNCKDCNHGIKHHRYIEACLVPCDRGKGARCIEVKDADIEEQKT